MLDHERLADHFHIYGHTRSAVGRGRAAGDVIGRTTALVFGFGQAKEPGRDIDLFDRSVDDVRLGGTGQLLVLQDYIGHVVLPP